MSAIIHLFWNHKYGMRVVEPFAGLRRYKGKTTLNMTRKELTDVIAAQVAEVINNPGAWGEDPQISIIPTTLLVSIERHDDAERVIAFNDYAIEADAVEDGDYSEDAADFQSASDPDLYPVGILIDYAAKKPDLKKIGRLVEQYIPEQSENLYAE